jgi:hypothetical protein
MNKLYAYPNQMIPLKEKLKVNTGDTVPEFIKANANYFSNERFLYTRDLHEMTKLFKVAEGKMWEDEKDHAHVTNPFGTEKEQYKRYPAKMKHYSIIVPIIDSFLGDKWSMPHNMMAKATNPEVQNEMLTSLQGAYEKALGQDFINQMNASGMDTGVPSKEVPEYGKIAEEHAATWQDTRSEIGQHAYNYIKQNCRLEEQYVSQMYDWLTVGRVVSYKDVHHNDVHRENVDPRNYIPIGMDSTSPFYEDAAAGVCIRNWSAASIINKFREKLKEEDIKWLLDLETKYIQSYNSGSQFNGAWERTASGTFATVNTGLIPIEHIVWQSQELRKILTYQDELGVSREMIVSEDYKLEKDKGDIALEDIWENQWWELWRVLDEPFNTTGEAVNKSLYLSWGIGKVQRNDIDNTSICKLPYNGRTRGERTTEIKSTVKDLIPHQELYDILHYRFELTLAKSKESLLLFPLQAIPSAKGWDFDRFMYSIGAFSIAFFDAADKDVKAAMQAMKSVDMALANYMNTYWSLMQAVRDEAWERVGMNRQRYGQSQASDLKGVTQQAIYQASLISKDLFETLNRYEEIEANGLLDYSKYAWIDGKKGAYIASDRRRVFFEINPVDYLDTNFGTFMVSSFDEKGKLESLRGLAQSVAQNSGRVGDVAEILDSTNFSELKRILSDADKAEKEFQQQQQQQQQETQKYIADKGMEIESKRDELERYKTDQKRESAKEVALITTLSFNAGADKDANGIDDAQQALDLYEDRLLKKADQEETKRSNMAKETIDREALKVQAQQNKQKNKTNTK